MDPQEDKVRKYLLNGESIIGKQELRFGNGPNVTLTIYKLSSGKFLIYSNEYDAVILGDEWTGIKDGEKLALQLLSLYAYDLYKPLNDFQPDSYNYLYYYWNQGSEIAKNYFIKRTIEISTLKLSAGMAMLLISSVATGGVGLIFVVGYGAGLAVALLNDLPSNFRISEENAPRIFLVLSLMQSENETAFKNFKESLNKLRNAGFNEILSNIAESLRLVEVTKDFVGLNFMMLYTFAARNPSLLQNLENIFGKEDVEKAGAYFIFDGDEESFKDFSNAVFDYWNGVPGSASKLSDILVKKATGTLGSAALGYVIDAITDYLINAPKDVDSLMGLHGAHSVLIRDLSLDLSNFLTYMQSQKYLPTLENIQSFFYHEYLLDLLLSEYDEGVSKLSTNTLYNTPEDLIRFWGFSPLTSSPQGTSTETWAGNILRQFSSFKSQMDQEANNTLTKALDYTIKVYKMFDEYKQDMARRKKTPSPVTGMNLFIVMDVSGSMNDNFSGVRKIDAAKKAATDLVSLASEQDSIGLVSFSDTAKLLSDLTTDKKLLVDEINKMQPEYSTALGDGIWLAIERLEASLSSKKPSAVVVLTDGMNNAGTHSPIEAALKAKSLNIPVYTLGFGEKNDIDENTLIKIAQATNAQYYYAPSPEDLRKIYISLSQRVSGNIVEKTVIQTIKKGEAQVIPTTIAPGTPYLLVKASYEGSNVSLTLQKPNGLNLTGTEGNVVYEEEPGYVSYVVYYPDPGEWKIKVIGVETPSTGEEYRLVVAKPGLAVEPQEVNVTLKPGESTKVKVKIKALRPISSLEVLKLWNFDFIDLEQSSFSNLQANEDIYLTVTLKAPDLSKGFFFRGLLGIRAVDSLIFLPVNIRITKFLVPTFLVNTSALYEGESLSLIVKVSDDNGNSITGASVKATIGNITRNLIELRNGFYGINFTGLSIGRKTVIVNVSKSEYTNVVTNLSVIITVLGDINKDGAVDYKDLALLIKSYGLSTFHPEAIASSDLNKDWEIDYKDLAILVRNYGKNVP